jgi:serine/threonine protein phosphatase PrpC
VPEILRYRFEIDEYFRPDDMSFMIIGCDGLWTGLGAEEAVKMVKKQLTMQWEKEGKHSNNVLFRFNVSRICEMMADQSVQSKDNVTVIVVLFRQEL